MIYEYVVRLLGKSIVKILYFLPILLSYNDTTITIPLELNNPITKEIKDVVKSGFKISLDYHLTLIINDSKLFKQHRKKTIVFNKKWYINDKSILEGNLQKEAGSVTISFDNFIFEENDHLTIFIKCNIVDDDDFSNSTGFKTSVLWNYYIPQKRQNFVFENGEFVKIEN